MEVYVIPSNAELVITIDAAKIATVSRRHTGYKLYLATLLKRLTLLLLSALSKIIPRELWLFIPVLGTSFLLPALLLAGCTTASWIVEEDPVTDPDSEQILSEKRFIQPVQTPTPQQPVLTLDFVREREVLYNRHLISKRHIQQYRPRYGYMLLGLSGMGFGLYLANTSAGETRGFTGRERALLNITAASIGVASVMSMTPEGESRPTGEERLLFQTGTWTVKDTIPAGIPENSLATFSIKKGDDILVDHKNTSISDNQLSINLIRETELQELELSDSTGLQVSISFEENTYEQYVPISSIMQQYVKISAPNTPIRTAPASLNNNIVQHVGPESTFPFLRDIDERWYRILKSDGITYVARDNARLVWQPAKTNIAGERLIPADQSVFGDIEIERNLPDNRHVNPEGIAIVIVNGAYSDPVRVLPNASRTGELISLYLRRVLGYYSDNIRIYENMTEREIRSLLESSDSLLIGDRYLTPEESDLFFYYYGHAFTDDEDRLQLVPVDYDPSERTERIVSFDSVAQTIGSVRSRNTIVVMDTDWSRRSVFGLPTESGVRIRSSLVEEASEQLLDRLTRGGIFWAAQPGQYAGSYAGSNGRTRYPYDIYTWYFFSALQNGALTTGDIEMHLERNVPFTSRRLHDRAQDPVYYGNRELNLINRP